MGLSINNLCILQAHNELKSYILPQIETDSRRWYTGRHCCAGWRYYYACLSSAPSKDPNSAPSCSIWESKHRTKFVTLCIIGARTLFFSGGATVEVSHTIYQQPATRTGRRIQLLLLPYRIFRLEIGSRSIAATTTTRTTMHVFRVLITMTSPWWETTYRFMPMAYSNRWRWRRITWCLCKIRTTRLSASRQVARP